jgi:hypothetical protein
MTRSFRIVGEPAMNLPLPNIADEAEPKAERPQPQVLVRVIVTPPGAPWEQARAAKLDAQHGAPLPISELIHQLRRLAPWAPGRPGRYAVFYLRAREFHAPFETTVEVDGQPLPVRFGTPARDAARVKLAGLALILLVLTGAVLGASTLLALRVREAANVRLEAAEQMATSRLRMAEAFSKRTNDTQDLRALVGSARPLSDVISDLTWVATSRTAEARIVGVHWDRSLLAVEARGDQPPLLAVDRPLRRSDRPLRPGVWLWAVGGRRPDGEPRPVSAEMGP